MSSNLPSSLCPVLDSEAGECVTLAHGEGARLTRELIERRIIPRFANDKLNALGDAARLPVVGGHLAFAADGFVVSPLFFPGGDIGKLAVFGTTNDLVVAGAQPLWLSLSLIIEEGLPLATLDRVLESIANAAQSIGVQIVAGDTKVVPRGAADALFITTSGIGQFFDEQPPDCRRIVPSDALIVTGPIAQHGMAIMSVRESFGVEGEIQSDCGSLLPAATALRTAKIPVRAMRDATRGGVAAVLHEWSNASGLTLTVEESKIPVSSEARGLCELLGIDPLFVANEGTMLAAVPAAFSELAVSALRQTVGGAQAVVIGKVSERKVASVTVIRSLGREVALDEPSGSFLPRIC